jgi:tetratricopeptide (TPR) repeat protein
MIFPYNKNNKTINKALFITGFILFIGICIYSTINTDLGYREASKLYGQKRYSEAYKKFLEVARRGNAEAQTDLGYMYETGLGISKNIDEAMYWYHEAAIRGNSRAKSNYAYLLEKQEKYSQAFTWLDEAANEGYTPAKLRLGCLYIMGKGINKNNKKGYELIREAAEKDSPGAQHLLGTYYQYGMDFPNEDGIKVDLKEAEKWYSMAKDKGYTLSKSALAYLWAEKGTNLIEAKTFAEEAAIKHPQEGYCIDVLGWVLFKQCNYTEAVIQLEKASQLSPELIRIKNHLAETYLILGEKEKAKEQWQKALELKPNDEKMKEKVKAKLDALNF